MASSHGGALLSMLLAVLFAPEMPHLLTRNVAPPILYLYSQSFCSLKKHVNSLELKFSELSSGSVMSYGVSLVILAVNPSVESWENVTHYSLRKGHICWLKMSIYRSFICTSSPSAHSRSISNSMELKFRS